MRDGRRWLQPYPDARRLIRRVFVAFLLTFIAARMLVIGIMARRLPDLFLHLGGTHVHHLDYGIFLPAGVGALLLLAGHSPPERLVVAWLYGVGFALTLTSSECGCTSGAGTGSERALTR